MEIKTYIIDAQGRVLGRVASEAAGLLRGKGLPGFSPNLAPAVKVKILHASEVKLTGNKLAAKTYKRYSGYPGGLKTLKFSEMFEKGPDKVLAKVIWGMLPKNKLRRKMLKNLVIER